ncbi:MAG: sodium:calcium antiporter [Vicinamibacteria bacterium]
MGPTVWVWLQFAGCVLLIGAAGSRLSRYGDVIAEKTGFSGTWIGVVMLATVTSLPELATGISAVSLVDEPDLAVGDVLGSCVFNLFIIFVLDFLHRKESVYTRASQGHILSAGFGIMMLGFAGFSLLVSSQGQVVRIGHVGLYSPLILVLYVLAMRTVFRYEHDKKKESAKQVEEVYGHLSFRRAVVGYSVAAAVVVGVGTWLPFVGRQIAHLMGWETTFVGTLFVAFATSVPEVVVTLTALRIGALDMAIGNVLGSNLFNVAILAVDDIFYLPGPLFDHVSPIHSVSAVSAIMMSGIAIVGLLYRPTTDLFRKVGWISLFLFLVYLLNSYVIYLYES